MDEDMVFTKRFVDCVRKPQDQRTEPVSLSVCVGLGHRGGKRVVGRQYLRAARTVFNLQRL